MQTAIEKLAAKARAATYELRVGVPNITHQDSGLPMPELAAIHEFGTKDGHIPGRAPFAKTVYANSGYKAPLKKATAINLRTGTYQGAEQLGLRVVGDVQKTISAGLTPENAKSTIKAKGSSKPLVNTGAFRQSITHEVRKGSK